MSVHRLFDKLGELVFFDQHRFGVGTDMKADFIEGDKIGGIGNGDKKPIAAFEQGQGMVSANQFFVDQLGDRIIQFQGINIEDRDPELLGGSHSQRQRVDYLVLYEVGDKRLFLLKRTGRCFGGIFFGE